LVNAVNRLFQSLLNTVGRGTHRPVSGWLPNAVVPGFPIAPNRVSFADNTQRVFGIARTPAQPRIRPRKTQATKLGGQRPRFCIARDAAGIWTLTGASREPAVQFSDLTVAISYARQDAGAAEADIELRVDGFYAFVHQPEGWPHRICAPARSTRTHH
jgi:hypothetical protein